MSQVSKAKKIQCSSWSDLPHDILNLIMDRLYYTDQIRFRAVCKSWKSSYGDKYIDKLPWLMAYKWYENDIVDSVTFECELYDPSYMQKYTTKRSIREKEREIFHGAEVRASKYGWVLFSKTQWDSTPLFFFYTPFSNNEIMKLPKLGILGLKAATFSTSPASLDCVICALSINNQKLYVSTCSPSDETWSTSEFDGFDDDKVKNMVFVDGTFYWIFSSGVLGAFSIALQELNIYMCPVIPKYAGFGYLVESDEHILTVYHMENGIPHQEDSVSRWYIFRFDQLRKNWIEVESLGNPLLFVGSTFLSIQVEGEASKLGNMIHANGLQLYNWIEDVRWLGLIWIQPPQSKA